MIGLGLKILGMGLVGSALSYGAYLGIEDIKWKASTDYPSYYWNKNYRTVSGGITDEDNVMLNYRDEQKWEKLWRHKSNSNADYKKDRSKDDWKEYRQWCMTYLREYVMNSKGDKNILDRNCLFDVQTRSSSN